MEQVLGAGYVDLLRLEGRIYGSVEDRLGYKPTWLSADCNLKQMRGGE